MGNTVARAEEAAKEFQEESSVPEQKEAAEAPKEKSPAVETPSDKASPEAEKPVGEKLEEKVVEAVKPVAEKLVAKEPEAEKAEAEEETVPDAEGEKEPEGQEEAEAEPEEEEEEKPKITVEDVKTAPMDYRFPTTNQAKHCYTRYNEYHKCVGEKGEDSSDCEKYARYYRSLCPGEWVERWNEARENGVFPGRY